LTCLHPRPDTIERAGTAVGTTLEAAAELSGPDSVSSPFIEQQRDLACS
jgi:hypothetical protein